MIVREGFISEEMDKYDLAYQGSKHNGIPFFGWVFLATAGYLMIKLIILLFGNLN